MNPFKKMQLFLEDPHPRSRNHAENRFRHLKALEPNPRIHFVGKKDQILDWLDDNEELEIWSHNGSGPPALNKTVALVVKGGTRASELYLEQFAGVFIQTSPFKKVVSKIKERYNRWWVILDCNGRLRRNGVEEFVMRNRDEWNAGMLRDKLQQIWD